MPRVAQMLPPLHVFDMEQIPLPPVAKLAVTNPTMVPEAQLSRGWRAAEVPGGNGQASGYVLAPIYAAVTGPDITHAGPVPKTTTPQPPRRHDPPPGRRGATGAHRSPPHPPPRLRGTRARGSS